MNREGGRACLQPNGRSGLATQVLCVLFVALGSVGCSAPEAEEVQAPDRESLYVDVTTEAGLGAFRHETGAFGKKLMPETFGSGGGFIDYDGDGWLDILLAGGGTWPESGMQPAQSLWLYRNNRDGTFTQATREAGLADVHAHTYGFAVADYDNDGDQDFYTTTVTENLLFRNDGGVFTDVSDVAGAAGEAIWSTAALFFDADRDGWLDLYVGNYVVWTPETDLYCTLDGQVKDYCTPQTYRGVPGRYYHSNGDGTFTDRTEQPGFLPAPGKTLGVAEFDFNEDGWPDLVVANDTEPDQLLVNNGDGTFTDRGATSGVAYDERGRTRAGMGIDTGIVDSTGRVSIFIGHFSKEMIGVYRYLGDGTFQDRSTFSRIGRPSMLTLTFGLFLFDVESDGDLDLFCANGHVQPDIEKSSENIRYAEPPHLFLNQGDGTFDDLAPRMGGVLGEALVARGAMPGDYDNDGDLDILVTENGRGAHLWRSNLNQSNFLRVRVEGRESNRSGLGTRIVAVAGGRWMERRIHGGSGYLSAQEQVATFGLGDRDVVDSLVVTWPSGRVERFFAVPGGQDVLVVEGSGSPARFVAEPAATETPSR